MSSEKKQEIDQLVAAVARADQEFASGLSQVAEHLLLHKLTRGSSLDSVPGLLERLNGKSNGDHHGGESGLDGGTNLARRYSAAVAMLEGMDPEGVSDMIALLRETSAPAPMQEELHPLVQEETSTPVREEVHPPIQEKVLEPIQIEARQALQEKVLPPQSNTTALEALPHVISCLKTERTRPMQKLVYDKFGAGASQRLYGAGEVYGTKIATEFRNMGQGIEKTIREIERIAKLAGWGDISFHRIDLRSVECTIKNTIFNYKRDEAKNSCHFAAGIAGGIISTLLYKGGRFIATETECISDGSGRCRFEIISPQTGHN